MKEVCDNEYAEKMGDATDPRIWDTLHV